MRVQGVRVQGLRRESAGLGRDAANCELQSASGSHRYGFKAPLH